MAHLDYVILIFKVLQGHHMGLHTRNKCSCGVCFGEEHIWAHLRALGVCRKMRGEKMHGKCVMENACTGLVRAAQLFLPESLP